MRFNYSNRPQAQSREKHDECGLPMLGVDEDDPRKWHHSTILDKTFCDCLDEKKMTTPKPREFWISRTSDEPIFESFIANKDPDSLSDNDNYMNVKTEHSLHVIEYSAYNQAVYELDKSRADHQAKLEQAHTRIRELEAALEKCGKCEVDYRIVDGYRMLTHSPSCIKCAALKVKGE